MNDSDLDMTDVADRVQDCAREIGKLTKAITGNASTAPVVNVAAPHVSVPSPKVVVTTPVTVIKESVQQWTFEVTSRDYNGYIKTFTATPVIN